MSSTTDDELRAVCGIDNGIHRRIILQHLSGKLLFQFSNIPMCISIYPFCKYCFLAFDICQFCVDIRFFSK